MNFATTPVPDQTFEIVRHFERSQQLQYLTVPFEVPEGVEILTIAYDYPMHFYENLPLSMGEFTVKKRVNTIDLGLIGPKGEQVGTSGSNKDEIFVSETVSTPGYQTVAITPGTWQILVGVYRVGAEGVDVTYTITFKMKQRRLLIGDLHTHTVGSDGILTLDHLARHARAHGLDFLAVTDHNQPISRESLPQVEGLTLIPGVEWTQFQGHANFLGVDQPYDGAFFANDLAGVQEKFMTAHERGALIVLNHIQDDTLPFTYNLASLPFDALEVWNGPMRMSNLRGIGMWDALLKQGLKVPAVGGSDYHADRFGQMLAGPCMGVYTQSTGMSDILEAVRKGQSYIVFQPGAATLDMRIVMQPEPGVDVECEELSLEADPDNNVGRDWRDLRQFAENSSAEQTILMGGTAQWQEGLFLEVSLSGLAKGDVVKLISPSGSRDVLTCPGRGEFVGRFPVTEPGYVRLELWQSYMGMLPPMPILVSNPIWIDF